MDLPINPEAGRRILDGAIDQSGTDRAHFLSVWDGTGGGAFAALLRSVAPEQAAR